MKFHPAAATVLAFGVLLARMSHARADPASIVIGATADALIGEHEGGGTVQRATLVPVPIPEIEVRESQAELRVEGIPPLGVSIGSLSVDLSVVNASLRLFAPGDRYYAGAGETIYNQQTQTLVSGETQTYASRVAGFRLETGTIVPLHRNDELQFEFAYNPAMYGVVRTDVGPPAAASIRNPERATQIDVFLRRVITHGRGQFIYGLRYINFTAKYAVPGSPIDGALADRNVGFLPLLGYRYRF